MPIGFQSKCSNISAEGLHFSAFHCSSCSCVPCEVLRQCIHSATNLADIIIIICAVHDPTRLKKNPILYFMPY